jgi:hypothetical protein
MDHQLVSIAVSAEPLLPRNARNVEDHPTAPTAVFVAHWGDHARSVQDHQLIITAASAERKRARCVEEHRGLGTSAVFAEPVRVRSDH